MKDIRIPEHWPPQVAMDVIDLLDDLRQAIWDRYEPGLVPLIISALHEPEPPDALDPGFDGDE